MSPAQLKLYRALWGQARRVLRAQGMEPKDAEAERHAIHVRELGRDKSSLALTNADFDKVKAAFLAITDDTDLGAQLAAQEQPRKRRLWTVRDLCARLEKSEAYALGIARQMQGGALASAGGLEDLGDAALDAVIVALKAEALRVAGKPARWRRKKPVEEIDIPF